MANFHYVAGSTSAWRAWTTDVWWSTDKTRPTSLSQVRRTTWGRGHGGSSLRSACGSIGDEKRPYRGISWFTDHQHRESGTAWTGTIHKTRVMPNSKGAGPISRHDCRISTNAMAVRSSADTRKTCTVFASGVFHGHRQHMCSTGIYWHSVGP